MSVDVKKKEKEKKKKRCTHTHIDRQIDRLVYVCHLNQQQLFYFLLAGSGADGRFELTT